MQLCGTNVKKNVGKFACKRNGFYICDIKLISF